MFYNLCVIVNVGLVFYKGSCERLILSLAVRLSLFLYLMYFICLFYEQINDDDDDGDLVQLVHYQMRWLVPWNKLLLFLCASRRTTKRARTADWVTTSHCRLLNIIEKHAHSPFKVI